MDDLDHRSLGVSLDLFHIQDSAPRQVFRHPRGYAIYRAPEDHIRREMRRAGYAEVRTPQLLPRELRVKSGHREKFGAQHVCAGGASRAAAPIAAARDGLCRNKSAHSHYSNNLCGQMLLNQLIPMA